MSGFLCRIRGLRVAAMFVCHHGNTQTDRHTAILLAQLAELKNNC